MKGGILVKDGKQTSCELAVLDSKSSIVSADCLNYSGGSIDSSVNYEVYLDDGIDGKAAKYSVDKVSVNPNYNATSLANNLAVLQYNSDSTDTWNNTVGIGRDTYWDGLIFVRRTLSDIGQMEWETPVINSTLEDNQDICKSMSVLFEANNIDFECSDQLIDAPITSLALCQVPFGSVYAIIGDGIYLAGIYSYTATYQGSGNLCSTGFKSSYYLLLSDYLTYTSNVIGSYPAFYPLSNATFPNTNAYYAMDEPTDTQDSNYRVTGGDYYSLQGDNLNQALSAHSEGISSDGLLSETETDSGSSNSSDQSHDSGNNGGQPNKTAIIAGVCASVGGILLACLMFFLYRLWKRRNTNKVDPLTQAQIRDMLETDIGGTVVQPANTGRGSRGGDIAVAPMLDYDLPPIYDDPQPNTATAALDVSNGTNSDYSKVYVDNKRHAD
ncbi:hypothetical protein IW140_005225 [Coemansia sp. RSA 1813]|nr:hypothetical protein EV178_004569 [Coemansia sp. RSA 1646]KAJ2090122.1 hypothetical protein IW138_002932 [Coemansia sp. RSA 986]KAJ2214199.1 hypothetical protein EV179_003219 [Coemansia sp. RSA 487]KAJ2565640.1 hypothetical protein IW140_005225 [Coemansia sp. RSA 1813]